MKSLLAGLVFLSSVSAYATNVCENNRFVNILALFVPLNIEIQGLSRDFNTHGCKKPVSGWIELLSLDQPISKHYVMSNRCDVGGPVRYTRKPFPVTLNVRNFGHIKTLIFQAEYVVHPLADQSLEVVGRVFDGEAYSDAQKKEVEFSGEYTIVFSGINGAIVENKGGTMNYRKLNKTSPVESICRFKAKT